MFDVRARFGCEQARVATSSYGRASVRHGPPPTAVMEGNDPFDTSSPHTNQQKLHVLTEENDKIGRWSRTYLLVHVSLPPPAPGLLLVCGTRVIACACVLLSVRGLQSVQWKLS